MDTKFRAWKWSPLIALGVLGLLAPVRAVGQGGAQGAPQNPPQHVAAAVARRNLVAPQKTLELAAQLRSQPRRGRDERARLPSPAPGRAVLPKPRQRSRQACSRTFPTPHGRFRS